jgi:tetratricopeptide (TPR) repeat protein
VYAQLHDWEKMNACFAQGAELAPDDIALMKAWGGAQCQAGQYVLAREKLEHLPDITQDSVACTQLATACLGMGDSQTALAHTDRLLIRRPHDPDLLALKGDALKHTGQWQQAIQLYQQAYALQPGMPLALKLASGLLAQGNPEEAIRLIRPWYRKHATMPDVVVVYSTALRNHGQWHDAEEKLQQLLDNNPNHFGALATLTEGYLQQWQTDRAQEPLQILITTYVQHPIAQWLRCWWLHQNALGPKTLPESELTALTQAVQSLLSLQPEHPMGLVLDMCLTGCVYGPGAHTVTATTLEACTTPSTAAYVQQAQAWLAQQPVPRAVFPACQLFPTGYKPGS